MVRFESFTAGAANASCRLDLAPEPRGDTGCGVRPPAFRRDVGVEKEPAHARSTGRPVEGLRRNSVSTSSSVSSPRTGSKSSIRLVAFAARDSSPASKSRGNCSAGTCAASSSKLAAYVHSPSPATEKPSTLAPLIFPMTKIFDLSLPCFQQLPQTTNIVV
jgi:hypothetical protein